MHVCNTTSHVSNVDAQHLAAYNHVYLMLFLCVPKTHRLVSAIHCRATFPVFGSTNELYTYTLL